MADGKQRKVMVTVAPDLVAWVEFNGTLSTGQSGMSGYLNRAARADMESASADRLKAFELWQKLHEGSRDE